MVTDVGGLVSNQWNFGGGDGGSGSGDEAYSTTTAQYFYAITLKDGWQITGSPVVTYDWKEATEGTVHIMNGRRLTA